MFRVGQKVVCVDDREVSPDIVRGEIYTIRWMGIWGCGHGCCPPSPSVRLVEVDRGPDPIDPSLIDIPFNPARFRPLVERKTDISIFTKMLTPTGRRKPVNV